MSEFVLAKPQAFTLNGSDRICESVFSKVQAITIMNVSERGSSRISFLFEDVRKSVFRKVSQTFTMNGNTRNCDGVCCL